MTFLGLKNTNIQMTIQICTWGTYTHTSCNVRRAKFEFYVSKYAIYKYSAFLWSFWSLWPWRSNRRYILSKFWMPVDYNLVWWKNYENSKFSISGLFQIFWDIWRLRSPLVCKNPISNHNFTPNSKWIKFPISQRSKLLQGPPRQSEIK